MRCIMSPSPKRDKTATLLRHDAARTHFLQRFEVFSIVFVCDGHGGLGHAHRLCHITAPRTRKGEIIESRGMARPELRPRHTGCYPSRTTPTNFLSSAASRPCKPPPRRAGRRASPDL